ncbi:hypothetical protein BDA99DRAFT_496548 [Phascolomyces articulosus]|uniref:Uncharacterized protein n=1 Tax=Phascolomyces articulosus TaxID=60185 RepID=A0AAD5KN86_9FUNG|nr:hypothetical protein BDA99DRAFT_496548 [Phascolomyces articulosus]
MKRPNNNGDSSGDRLKRQVTDADRSFETVSTIESLSDPEDKPYISNERFAITGIDNDDNDDNFFAHDETLVMSFDEIHSNIVSQQDDSQHRTSDPIATFTDEDIPTYQNGFYEDEDEDDIVAGSSEVYSQNILDGLADWKPTRGFPSPTEQASLPLDDDDDILSSFITDDDELMTSQQQQRPSNLKNTAPATIEGAPIPDFRFQSSSLPKVYPKVPPVPTNNNSHHHHHRNLRYQDSDYKPPEPLEFKDGGPARPIIKRISQAAKDHAEWEKKVRAEMAKLGSIPNVCSLFDNATLFRILESWTEHGLTFGRCVQVRSNELTLIMHKQQASATTLNIQSNNNYHSDIDEDEDDMIDELISQSTSLPPYTPIEGEEEFIILFSFAYMPQITASIKTRFLQEECVAIWTPWTVVSDTQREIYVVTRFLSYSLY